MNLIPFDVIKQVPEMKVIDLISGKLLTVDRLNIGSRLSVALVEFPRSGHLHGELPLSVLSKYLIRSTLTFP
jgi:hypothetical protein